MRIFVGCQNIKEICGLWKRLKWKLFHRMNGWIMDGNKIISEWISEWNMRIRGKWWTKLVKFLFSLFAHPSLIHSYIQKQIYSMNSISFQQVSSSTHSVGWIYFNIGLMSNRKAKPKGSFFIHFKLYYLPTEMNLSFY